MNTVSVSETVRRAWSRCSAVIFDFDGVIADSEPFFRKSWNLALEPWGHRISQEDYWLYWSSMGDGLAGEIRRYGLENIDADNATIRQKSIYEQFSRNGDIPLFPSAGELLRRLSSDDETAGKPFCIASNTPSRIVTEILMCQGAHIPLIVGGESLRKKPAPDIFLRAASELGVKPSNTLIFEDSWKGIRAAVEGGFRTVLVLNSQNRNLDINSELVIDGIGYVIKLLDSLNKEESCT